ncbi:hypothetical protein SETIT_7G288800v2 [Setaria italica]|uniref:Uncharacterized protein n=2 Tax=Setaria TaxID=4554 RepID=A0A368S140_SETIT|nr:hypothetical protein SETIT_7G288800v2 [Setaria italica]TKW07260.1 hypothetical protein SEVIR_7G296966v2 [Setaria viridis]TKW07305.1 hypothetical protein SEVIR_7G297112v2 [Setaria viridis]
MDAIRYCSQNGVYHKELQVVREFGSFNNYYWSFVNHKPITNCFFYARQISTKTPKVEAISKDLMR